MWIRQGRGKFAGAPLRSRRPQGQRARRAWHTYSSLARSVARERSRSRRRQSRLARPSGPDAQRPHAGDLGRGPDPRRRRRTWGRSSHGWSGCSPICRSRSSSSTTATTTRRTRSAAIDSSRAVYLIHRRRRGSRRRPGGRRGRGHPGGAGAIRVRHGRRPPAPAGAARGDVRARRWRSASDVVVGEPLLRGRRQGRLRPPALGAVARVHARRDAAVPDAPVARERPDERMLHGPARGRRPRLACARAASRSCSRSSSGRPGLRVSEVPLGFGERHAGHTKASVREALRYLRQLGRLGAGPALGPVRPLHGRRRDRAGGEHAAAGAVRRRAGIYYVLAAILATQGSTLWNFCLTEAWVFAGRDHKLQPAGGAR